MSQEIFVITCISDGDIEGALIAQLPDAIPGCQIIFRNSDPQSILNFVGRINFDQGRAIIFHDCRREELSAPEKTNAGDKHLYFDVNNLDLRDTSALILEIGRKVRQSEVTKPSRKVLQNQANVVVVTGSHGAPGISSITANLAWKVSSGREVIAIDKDPIRQDLHYLFNARGQDFSRVSTRLRISTSIPEAEPEELLIIDAGPAPQLRSAQSDRRRVGREFMDLVERAGAIIYVTQPEKCHNNELSSFFSELQELGFGGWSALILNKYLSCKEHRLLFREIESSVRSVNLRAIPRDVPSFDRAKAASLLVTQVSARSKVRKAVDALATDLIQAISHESVRSTGVTCETSKREHNSQRARK